MATAERTVLVAGGAGYIGAHACKALAAAGYLPIAYDDLSGGHARAVKWGPLEQGDIADRARVADVIARWRPVGALHFAAFINVGESVVDPAKYWRNNVCGTLAFLESLRDGGVDKLVFSSTCAVYGLPGVSPLHEDLPTAPINAYGETKLAVERLLRDFRAAHGLRAICPRYFNAAGADPDGEIGEDHSPETHLIPLAIDAALGRRDRLTINGDDYDTPDGTCIRDYIHVSDLASAHVKALDRLLEGMDSAALNLGVGRGYSVRAVVETVGRVAGRPVPHVIGPRRPGDPAELVADARRAREALGWTPVRTDLEDIVRDAYAWRARA